MDVYAANVQGTGPGAGLRIPAPMVGTRFAGESAAFRRTDSVEFFDVESFVQAVEEVAGGDGIHRLFIHNHGLDGEGFGPPPAEKPSSAFLRGAIPSCRLAADEEGGDWTLGGVWFGRCLVTLQNFEQFEARLGRLAPLMNPGAHAVMVNCSAGRDPLLLYRFAELWGVPCSGSSEAQWGDVMEEGLLSRDDTWTTAMPDASFHQWDGPPPSWEKPLVSP